MDEDIFQAGMRNARKDSKLMEMWAKLSETNDNGELASQMYRHILRYHENTPDTLYEIDNKIEKLEIKVFGKQRNKETYRSQQILILHYLGVFDSPVMKKITTLKQKAKLLSILLNAHKDNIEGDLSMINLKASKLKSETNLEFVQSVFEEAGLSQIVKEIDMEINQASKAKKPK